VNTAQSAVWNARTKLYHLHTPHRPSTFHSIINDHIYISYNGISISSIYTKKRPFPKIASWKIFRLCRPIYATSHNRSLYFLYPSLRIPITFHLTPHMHKSEQISSRYCSKSVPVPAKIYVFGTFSPLKSRIFNRIWSSSNLTILPCLYLTMASIFTAKKNYFLVKKTTYFAKIIEKPCFSSRHSAAFSQFWTECAHLRTWPFKMYKLSSCIFFRAIHFDLLELEH
jgi:hypothetical protein